MKMIILLISLFLSQLAFSKDECKRRESVCRIIKLSPHINLKKAEKYAKSIERHATASGMDIPLVMAIIMQESSFREVILTKLVPDTLMFQWDHELRIVRKYAQKKTSFENVGYMEMPNDIGLMQVNVDTAKIYGYDVDRLIKDYDYQIKVGVEILARKMRYCQHMEFPWGCYNSMTQNLYAAYVERVWRWF